MLSQQDVGQRVVVRRVVGERDGRPLLTDALGILTALTETELSLTTDHGPLTVPRASVVAAKRIPPRPPKRRPRAAGS
jgi:hypothetical protein